MRTRRLTFVGIGIALILLLSAFVFIPSIPNTKTYHSTRSKLPLNSSSNQFLAEHAPSFNYPMLTRDDPWAKCSANLKQWIDSGQFSENLRIVDGEVAITVNVRETIDWLWLEERLDVKHITPFGPGYIVYGFIPSMKPLANLVANPDVLLVMGDEKHENDFQPPGNQCLPYPGVDVNSSFVLTEIERIRNEFPLINGSGTVIGVADTGVDFGRSDLVDAIAVDGLGRPLSFDPGGSGIALTSFALPSVGGYLLTEGLDFKMYRNDGLIYWSNSTYGITLENMYVGGFGGIPSLSGFYRIGMSVQITYKLPRSRAFFTYILADETSAFTYDTVYVDFETSWAITAQYNEMSTPILADWDFTNNNPHRFDSNPVLAEDLDGDGFNDYSMGSLCHTFDLTQQITGDLVSGIDPQGRGFAFMFDNDGTGTSLSHAIASRGVEPFDFFGNGTSYVRQGVAVGTTIMALKTDTLADEMHAWFWGCGYRPLWGPDWPYRRFTAWQNDTGPGCDFITNQWRVRTWSHTGYDMIWSYDWYSMLIDWLSVDSGILFINNQGNSGPGYGTGQSPYSTNALQVGISNIHYSIPEGYTSTLHQDDGVASFSSNGPTPQGMSGPDVVAPPSSILVLPLHNLENDIKPYYNQYSIAIPTGVCALLKQANNNLSGDVIKTLIMNGADDLGYDIYRQGAGRVNGYRSLHLAFGNSTDGTDPLIHLFSYDTFLNQYVENDRQVAWRGWYMNMLYGYDYIGNPMDYTIFNPTGNLKQDGKVCPQPIYRGDSTSFNVSANTGLHSSSGISNLTAYTYEQISSSSVEFDADTAETTLNLTSAFGSEFTSQFFASDYATIHLTFPWTDYNYRYRLAGNRVYLFDWTDANRDGDMNPSNNTEGQCIAADTSQSNCHQICIGFPGYHFSDTPALFYYDSFVDAFHGLAVSVNVTILLYERVEWNWFTFHQYMEGESPNYPLEWNTSVSVPVDAVPGFYEGYIEGQNSTGIAHLPISLRIDTNLSAPGVYQTWGGSQGAPYDNGATFGGISDGYSKQAGDWRFYFVDAYPTVTDVSYILVNVTWSDPNTRIDVMLYFSSYGYNLEERFIEWDDGRWVGEPTCERQNVLIFDASHDGRGIAWGSYLNRGLIGIALRTSQFGGTSGGPEDFWVTVGYAVENHPSSGSPAWNLPVAQMNVTDSTHALAPLTEDSDWVGPQITFYSTWSDLVLPEFSSISIQRTSLSLVSTIFDYDYGTIDYPVFPGWHPDHNPREAYAYLDLLAGSTVQITVEFGTWMGHPSMDTPLSHGANDDLDLFIWAPGVNNTFENSLTGAICYTCGNPEMATFVAPVSGTYTIGLDYYSGVVPMGWKLKSYAYISYELQSDGQTCSFDTALTNTNARYAALTTFITGTSLDWGMTAGFIRDEYISNVGVENYFAPTITSIDPDGGEELGPEPFVISWTAIDPNTAPGDSPSLGEILGFSVEVTNDSGLTWKVITYGTTRSSITYDPFGPYYGLGATTEWLVRVNCTDGMYTTSRTSAATFSIWRNGGLPPPPLPPIIELYIIITGMVMITILLVVLGALLLWRRRILRVSEPVK